MSEQHRHHYADERCTEIAPNVCLRPTVHGGDPDVTDTATGEMSGGSTEHLAGFIFAHDRDGFDIRCEGAVNVDPHAGERATWSMSGTLEGGDLTLNPSILCRGGRLDPAGECGFHGFVQNGKWVSA